MPMASRKVSVRSLTPVEVRGRSFAKTFQRVRRILYENGLSIVALCFFAIFMAAQAVAGHRAYNEEQREHRQPTVGLSDYLRSSHFAEATFENWESEFLQMGAFVFLTAILVQRGSAESKAPYREPSSPKRIGRVPGPARHHGWVRLIYENSLGLAFLVLFAVMFALHGLSGAANYNADQTLHGHAAISIVAYFTTAQFWFESFQNWQSEFLAVAAMVILSIFLRQKGSPESKEVEEPHSKTGT